MKTTTMTMLVVLCVGRPAVAAPITFTMFGPVLYSGSEFAPVGSPARLSITWEPNTPNGWGCTTGRDGRYDAIRDAVLTVGGHSAHFGGGAIEVNAPEGNCGTIETGVGFHMFGFPSPGLPEGWLFWEIFAAVGPANANALTLAKILADVTDGAIWVNGFDGGFYFDGPVVVTPEPTSLALLGLGLLATARQIRRRRNDNGQEAQ